MSSVVTGYYRYTDIWFEWFKVIEGNDRFLIKAAFAHDALVHPDHPLHKEGVKGIEMYTGTLQSGETRLLFSSAQVDYVRYWLHAMKLTENYVPLPYSECLLTVSDLRTVGPIVFEDGGSIRKACKKIDKNNKRLKGTNPSLTSRRDTFERVRNLWSAKIGTWCALDFESWDRDHSLVTEFGWSLVRWECGGQTVEKGHLIVKDYLKFTNTYVPNHREYYNFGESERIGNAAFKTRIRDIIDRISAGGPVFLVFHDNAQDIKYLRQYIGIPLADLRRQLPDSVPQEGMFVVDTADLFAALEGDGERNTRSLDRVCKHLQIPTRYLHNAGNDAHYTFLAMRSMASGEPLDLQRETRWPNQTDTTGNRGPKVQFEAWEENSDYSDLEGVVPFSSGYDPTTGNLLSHSA